MSTQVIDLPVSDVTLNLELFPNVFEPTTTTQILGTQMGDVEGKTVLDMGCGNGPIAIAAALRGAKKVYAVDVMPEACEATRSNAERNGVRDRVEARAGDLFEPVDDMQFDVIVNDVSGIADDVARITPWYPDPIPTGGPDGTQPPVRMLRDSKSHLSDGGFMLFPISGLSNAEKIIATGIEIYGAKFQLIKSRMIPFCKELYDNIDLLSSLREEGIIDFVQKRSRFVWELTIYRAEK